MQILRKRFFVPILLLLNGVLPFVVYARTMVPGLTLGDSGELIAASHVLGIAHPAGFPLYLVFVHFFSLPFSDPAFAANFFSVLSGAATSMLLAWSVWMLTRRWWLALFLPWVFVFFPLYWDQATMAEVYTTHTVFIAAMFAMVIMWKTTKRFWPLPVAALFLGSAVSVHTASMMLVPIFLLFLLFDTEFPRRSWRTWMIVAGMFVVGCLWYLYLPIRSAMHPSVAWADLKTPTQVVNHILRKDYHEVQPPSADIRIASKVHAADVGGFYQEYVLEMVQMFGYALLAIAGFGIYTLRRARAFAFFFAGSIILTPVLLIISAGNSYASEWSLHYRTLFLFCLIPLTLLAAIGIHRLLQLHVVKRLPQSVQQSIAPIAGTLLLLCVITILAANYRTEDRSSENQFATYMTTILQRMAPNAVFAFRITNSFDESTLSAMLFLQKAVRVRPDITVVTPVSLSIRPAEPRRADTPNTSLVEGTMADKEFLHTILTGPFRGRPLYSLEPFSHTKEVFSRSDGLLYRLFATEDEARSYMPPPHSTDYNKLFSQFFKPELNQGERQMLADYYYARAMYFHQERVFVKAGRSLLLAIAYDPYQFSVSYYKYIAARNDLEIHTPPT